MVLCSYFVSHTTCILGGERNDRERGMEPLYHESGTCRIIVGVFQRGHEWKKTPGRLRRRLSWEQGSRRLSRSDIVDILWTAYNRPRTNTRNLLAVAESNQVLLIKRRHLNDEAILCSSNLANLSMTSILPKNIIPKTELQRINHTASMRNNTCIDYASTWLIRQRLFWYGLWFSLKVSIHNIPVERNYAM